MDVEQRLETLERSVRLWRGMVVFLLPAMLLCSCAVDKSERIRTGACQGL